MTVAANKGNEVEEQARNMATRFRIPRCILAPLDQCKNGAIRSDSSGKLQNQRIPFHRSWTDLSGFDEDDNGFGI